MRFIEMEAIEGTILVEIEENNVDGLELIGIKEKISSLKDFLDSLFANGKAVIEKAKELTPDELEISFGIKGGVEFGTPVWGLAKATSESSINIKMKWKK